MDERTGFTTPTCWRPRPTGPWSARPAGWWWSPTTPSGASSGISTIAALAEADVLITDAGLDPEADRAAHRAGRRAHHRADADRTSHRGCVVRKTTTTARRRARAHLLRRDATATTTDRTTVVDPRDLEPTSTASEIRYDALLDEWVAIASHRQGRTHLPPADECPLCPSRDGRHTEIPASDYDVVVFENRFPSFAEDADPGSSTDGERRGRPRPVRGRLLHHRPRHRAEPALARAGPPRARGLDRPHRGAGRPAGGRAGLLLREPRRGDRRHAGPPARPDLRLPVRHAAHPHDAARPPGTTASAPAATSSPTGSPPSWPTARGS